MRESQMRMANFLRNPEEAPPPPGVEARRLQIYQDLIYNNIEGFISSGFPVLRSLYSDEDWHSMVRDFIDGHRCESPYFLEISQEFLRYLMERREPQPADPAFAAELAHYEWVELALDVAEEQAPPLCPVPDMAAAVPALSPLAWVLSYHFPVHRIGPGHEPSAASEPVFLAVYRNREDDVKFVELNAATARLLELVRENQGGSAAAVLAQLAAEMGSEPETIANFGLEQLAQFHHLGIVALTT
ncbi:MAG: putative DNA-binding domain-containing protein [Pseudomonadota bacterium]